MTPVLAQVCGNPLRSIKAVKKLMHMLPVAVESIPSVALMSMVDAAPYFDSTEPGTKLTSIPITPEANGIALVMALATMLAFGPVNV